MKGLLTGLALADLLVLVPLVALVLVAHGATPVLSLADPRERVIFQLGLLIGSILTVLILLAAFAATRRRGQRWWAAAFYLGGIVPLVAFGGLFIWIAAAPATVYEPVPPEVALLPIPLVALLYSFQPDTRAKGA